MSEVLMVKILTYLSKHPAATDTVDGISAWWLGVNAVASREEVEQTLEELRQRGWVSSRGEGAQRIHQLNAEALQEVRTYLRARPFSG